MSELENKLAKFREEYYNKNKKKTFFKKTQKNDCAEKVTQQFSLNELLEESIFRKEHVIFCNYPVIKTFLHPNIYESIMNHIDTKLIFLLENFNVIDIKIDMKSFTITAAQRYNDLIQCFCKKYLQNENFIQRIQVIYIVNTPSLIEVLRKMFSSFMSSTVNEKIIFLK